MKLGTILNFGLESFGRNLKLSRSSRVQISTIFGALGRDARVVGRKTGERIAEINDMYCPLYRTLRQARRLTSSFELMAKNSQNQNERTTNASKRFPLYPAALFSDSLHELPIRSFG
jgi:hypothetical protein